MEQTDPPAKVASNAQLGLAPEHDFIGRTIADYAAWCKTYYRPEALGKRGMISLYDLWAWKEQERRVTLAVAAERERWAAPVRALLAAHDAALERVGKMMQANGMMTLNLPAEVNDEFKAVHALRDVLRA